MQFEFAWQSLSAGSRHSSMSVQKNPLPSKPAVLHVHVYEPAVLVQLAYWLQRCVPAVHSSTSSQCVPLPVYPEGQVHVKDPAVSVHVATVAQS